jgi:hypothetical protein
MPVGTVAPLAFYRLTNHEAAGEVSVVDADGGEMTVVLHDLDGLPGLSPEVRAFADGSKVLRRAIRNGLLEAVAVEAESVDEFVQRLERLGMVDGRSGEAGGR